MGVLHAAHLLELAETELCNMADLDGLERRLSGGMHVLEPWIYSLQHTSFFFLLFFESNDFRRERGDYNKYQFGQAAVQPKRK